MKRLSKAFLLALGLTLMLPALMQAAPGGHGGGHFGGRTRVFIGVGGGWGWGWWGWPGWYGPGYDGYSRPRAYGPSSPWGVVDTDISPEEARVYLDGRDIGTADDFDGYPDFLYLKPGHYRIEFRLQGYETLVREVNSRPGMYVDYKDKLRKVPGARRYGSYDTPKPQGEVNRYFGKRRELHRAGRSLTAAGDVRFRGRRRRPSARRGRSPSGGPPASPGPFRGRLARRRADRAARHQDAPASDGRTLRCRRLPGQPVRRHGRRGQFPRTRHRRLAREAHGDGLSPGVQGSLDGRQRPVRRYRTGRAHSRALIRRKPGDVRAPGSD